MKDIIVDSSKSKSSTLFILPPHPLPPFKLIDHSMGKEKFLMSRREWK
jgi:hypothetical protein